VSAAAGDLLQKVGLASATTLDSNYTINDTTVTVASTAGWPSDTGVTFAIDVIDSQGVQVPGTYNEYVGTVATGTSISNVDWADGNADRNYTAGATTRVYIPVSKTRENRIVTWGLVHGNQDGTLKTDVAVTTANATLTSPKVITGINDTNGNELIKVTATGSAVNELTVTNAATANAPSVSATGGDTNIDLRLTPKGTGRVKKGASGGAIDAWEELASVELGSSNTTLSTGTITAKKHLMVQSLVIGASTGDVVLTFNSDTSTNYATTFFANGGASSSNTSQSGIIFRHGALVNGQTQVSTGFVVNFASYEKVMEWSSAGVVTAAGATNAPGRIDGVSKWTNTSSQITSIQMTCSGNMASGTKLVVLGHD